MDSDSLDYKADKLKLPNGDPRPKLSYRVDDEGEDGYWVYYSSGWCSTIDPVCDIHFDHEYNKRELNYRIRHVRPCDCDGCLNGIAKSSIVKGQ